MLEVHRSIMSAIICILPLLFSFFVSYLVISLTLLVSLLRGVIERHWNSRSNLMFEKLIAYQNSLNFSLSDLDLKKKPLNIRITVKPAATKIWPI